MTVADLVTELIERSVSDTETIEVEIETPDGKRWQADKLRREDSKILVLVASI